MMLAILIARQRQENNGEHGGFWHWRKMLIGVLTWAIAWNWSARNSKDDDDNGKHVLGNVILFGLG